MPSPPYERVDSFTTCFHQTRSLARVALRLRGQLYEVFHEDAEANIVRENGLPLGSISRVVSHRRVELGDQEPSLGLVLIAHLSLIHI